MPLLQRVLWSAGLSPQFLLERLAGREADGAEMTEEQARLHFAHLELEDGPARRVVRYFHQWLLDTLRARIGDGLAAKRLLDVGASDGLLLKHLGQSGVGLNISTSCIARMRDNDIEAVQGDIHELPFADDSFDFVLCFETLEHTQNPHGALSELARVCSGDGRVFVTIPYVARSRILSLDPDELPYESHVFELADDDFRALVSHTPLRVVWEATCEVLAPPRAASERLAWLAWRNEDVIGGMFRRFAFYELAGVDPTARS